MTYAEAVRWLYSLTRFGMKPGLGVTLRLAELAGNPHAGLRFIHVAGTNGKGSVCAFLESIYRRAGLRVGLYTSPHLVSFRERVQIDRKPAAEAEVARHLTRLRELAEREGLQPTFFEYVTVMAWLHFAAHGCDLVVLETGMGGRLDATNIVTPLVSVITPVGLDHAAHLGSTLRAIAGEKAGIIKPGVPAVVAARDVEVNEVFQARAKETGAMLSLIDVTKGDAVDAALAGEYRRCNARLAAAVVAVLNGRDGLPRIADAALVEGLAVASWPGRLQIVKTRGRTWLLDGAHNEDGLQALIKAVPEFFPDGGRTLILGMLNDKEVGDGTWATVGATFDRVVLVPVASTRGGDSEPLRRAFQRVGVTVDTAADLNAAIGSVDSAYAVIAGSLYLIGEALERLGAVPASLRSERELNEYGR